MNSMILAKKIRTWEPEGAEVVRCIDSDEDTLERILKYQGDYYLYRYFALNGDENQIQVSIDLNAVHPDRVIQELGERL